MIDCSLRLLQFGLTQFHNRAEPEPVASLSEIQRSIGFSEELFCDGYSFERSARVQPRGAHIAHNLIAERARLFVCDLYLNSCLRRLGADAKSSKNRDAQVCADSPIPVRVDKFGGAERHSPLHLVLRHLLLFGLVLLLHAQTPDHRKAIAAEQEGGPSIIFDQAMLDLLHGCDEDGFSRS